MNDGKHDLRVALAWIPGKKEGGQSMTHYQIGSGRGYVSLRLRQKETQETRKTAPAPALGRCEPVVG
ncbi:MAG: hypothetical protein EOM52_05015 [Clostridia bacterium]|nr:hypothetical protein [Clostridia bacterium]